jgi:hypothetical protein
MNVNAVLVHRLVTKEVRKILRAPEMLGGLWQKLSENPIIWTSCPEEA